MVNELTPVSSDPTPLASQCLEVLFCDYSRLTKIDRYFRGNHDDPYLPNSEDPELKQLMRKSILNLMDHAVETPAEKMYVDSVRPGRTVAEDAKLPEWDHWQLSRLDSRQQAIYKSAFKFGHCFTVTEERRGKIQTKSLSPLRTAALYADPANDETPAAALTVTLWPDPKTEKWGEARLWDDVNEYVVIFKTFGDFENLLVGEGVPHGASSCPVTRFAMDVDTEGRTTGVIEPLVNLQDRINQTIYHLLSVEASDAYKVKTISGMAPPIMRRPVTQPDGSVSMEPVLDEEGQPKIDKVRINPAMILWAENKDTKFGTLDHTPLDGFLQSVGDAIRQFTSKSRVPPHFMLGEIANLSADALEALSQALANRVESFKTVFGESWERVFRLAAELNGISGAIDDYSIEVVWRETDTRPIAEVADAIQKLSVAGFPPKSLIKFIPNMTKTWELELIAAIEEKQAKDEEAQRAAIKQAAASATTRVARPAPKTGASKATADKVP